MIKNSLLCDLNNFGYITDDFIHTMLKRSRTRQDVLIFKKIVKFSDPGFSNDDLYFAIDNELEESFIDIINKISHINILKLFTHLITGDHDIKWFKILFDKGIKILSIYNYTYRLHNLKYFDTIKQLYDYACIVYNNKKHNVKILNSIFYDQLSINKLISICLQYNLEYLQFLYNFIPLDQFNKLLIQENFIKNNINISQDDTSIIVELLHAIHANKTIDMFDIIFNIDYKLFLKMEKKILNIIILHLLNSLDYLKYQINIDGVFMYILSICDNEFQHIMINIIKDLLIYNFSICGSLSLQLLTMFHKYKIFAELDDTINIITNPVLYNNTELIKFIKVLFVEIYSAELCSHYVHTYGFGYSDFSKLMTELEIPIDLHLLKVVINKHDPNNYIDKICNFQLLRFGSKYNYENSVFYLENNIITDTILLHESIRINNEKIFKYLLNKNYNLKQKSNIALKIVCTYGRIHMLKYFEQQNCSFINSVFATISIKYNNASILKFLLKNNCNIHNNKSLYTICAKNDNVKILNILIENNYKGIYDGLLLKCLHNHKYDFAKVLIINGMYTTCDLQNVCRNNINIYNFSIKNNIPNCIVKIPSNKLSYDTKKYLIYYKQYRNYYSIHRYKHYLKIIVNKFILISDIIIPDICFHIFCITMNL